MERRSACVRVPPDPLAAGGETAAGALPRRNRQRAGAVRTLRPPGAGRQSTACPGRGDRMGRTEGACREDAAGSPQAHPADPGRIPARGAPDPERPPLLRPRLPRPPDLRRGERGSRPGGRQRPGESYQRKGGPGGPELLLRCGSFPHEFRQQRQGICPQRHPLHRGNAVPHTGRCGEQVHRFLLRSPLQRRGRGGSGAPGADFTGMAGHVPGRDGAPLRRGPGPGGCIPR